MSPRIWRKKRREIWNKINRNRISDEEGITENKKKKRHEMR